MTPGYYESPQNYSYLNFRLQMPFYDHSKNQYYSFNQGKIHFIAINYLFYKTEQEGSDKQKDNANRMYQWVKNDLATANATRDYRPW
eukprot:CAMPEP_0114575496 /NCGR_PEP_ID=MMETSP0125-20121206/355_1 /TAXON_ID=485358 ORGANISM="Aristerostoma sp., Strain ATCC 50986" /NCGR_SAMPLE_ID=MMETSP0125 /ASSEMBLY_ACC=CAM_ASM_000245 /LENGTH=86 /DNA_ID=CAMNT_0001763263 /DNA_START=617 /DNA_END=874 /DNA_ORIENTATION=-